MKSYSIMSLKAVIVLCLLFLISGCATKAKTIQAGAAQFEAEALEAIKRIDELREAELAASPVTPEKATENFLKLVKGSEEPIRRSDLRTLIKQYDLDLEESDRLWREFVSTLRLQYQTFASAFGSLDKGALFATPAVEKLIPHLEDLIGQMSGFARSISENPPEFTRKRAEIAFEIEIVRDDPDMSPDAKDLAFRDLERRLRELAGNEIAIADRAVAQAEKAVTIGMNLKGLMEAFDDLSAADVAGGLKTGARLVSAGFGVDVAGFQSGVDNILGQVQNDPAISTVMDAAFEQLNTARERSEGPFLSIQ